MTTTVVVAGGPDPPRSFELPPGARVIAADGGVAVAAQLGLPVDLVVGDLDSGSAAEGVEVERHAPDKDASDLELALDAAVRLGTERLVVVSGVGGRLDHLLGTLLLLARDAHAPVTVDAQLGEAAAHVIRGARALTGEPGDIVSLFAVHGAATGVTTEGLRYPLDDETLEAGSTRGLSNVFDGPAARVSVRSGVLVAVRPRGSAWAASAP